MKHPGPASAAATRLPFVRPRFRAAFLLALASLLFGGAPLWAQTPVFVNWPSSITNVWQSSQVTYSNSTYPTGLPVSNAVQVSASFVSNSISTNITGFSFNPNPGWGEGPPTTGDGSGPGAILLYFTPGTNPAISQPYTNTLQIVLSNPPRGTSATTNIEIVITPPPPDYPVFTGSFSNQWSASASAQPISPTNLTGCRVASPASNSPSVFPVPDITNATQVYVRFVSNSLGQTSGLTNVALTPSNSYYATSNGFGIQGPYTGVGDLNLHPANPNPWSSANNTEAIASAVGYSDGTNVWVSLNVVPGTNTIAVTNYLQLLAVQGDNSSTLNWTTNDLAVVVSPVVPFTPYLGITFTNDSYTNDPNLTNVWLSFAQGQGTVTSIGYVSNNTTNITWSGSNAMSDPVALSTVNANGGLAFTQGSSVIGYISYGAALGSLSNAPSPVDTTDASYQTPWVQFELTRGGTAAGLLAGDVGDLTFINEFSAPLYIQSYDTNGNLLQYSGFGTNTTATILQALAAVTQTNPQAVITNNGGQYVRVVAPVSFNDFVGPYDNFNSYITNLAANNAVAYLQNFSGFTVSSNANSANYNFTFTMTNHYHADGTMSIKGLVVATNTVQGGSTNFTGLKILYATNTNSTVTNIGGAIYGANYASASNTIFFVNEDEDQTGGGSNWLAMSNYMVSVYTDPAHQTGSNAYYTVLSQMVGEVSSTIESGLAGSTNIVSNGSVSGVLGTNLSQNWWTMTNPLSIMRFAQTNPLNYDQYGDVIFYYSSNSVYNFSYNDRYNNAKPVVFANIFNGTNVGSWVIGVGAPVSTVSAGPTPTPSGFWQVPSQGGYNWNGKGLGELFTTNGNWQDPNVMQLTILNWQQSMTDAAVGSSGYSSTNLPRGLHVINRWVTTNATPDVVTNSWQGFIVGRMIDQLPILQSSTFSKIYAQTSTITAFNPVGQTNDTNFVLEIIVTGKNAPYPNTSTNTNAPVPYGVTTFNATNNQVFSSALFYYNTPSYWEATGLPAGLTLRVDLNPEGTDVQASIVGTPTNGSGTMTATIYAVNVLRSNAPYSSLPATNTNTITFNFGAPSPSYLSYSGWVGAWALAPAISGGTADPDSDGFDNNDEYAFGGNPTNPTPYLLNISGSNISYIGLTNAGTNYIVQNTTNLMTGVWTNYTTAVSNSTNQLNIPLPSYYQRKEFTVPLTGTNNFYRVIFSNQ